MTAIQQSFLKSGPGAKRKTIDAPKGKKQCSKCLKVRAVSSFSKCKNAYDGLFPQCRLCKSEFDKATRAKAKAKHLERKYGLAEAQYWEMFERQGGVCAVCGQPETQVLRGAVSQLSVDHDHTTGRVRGLLCHHCNTAIGLLRDDTAILEAAIAYLKSH